MTMKMPPQVPFLAALKGAVPKKKKKAAKKAAPAKKKC